MMAEAGLLFRSLSDIAQIRRKHVSPVEVTRTVHRSTRTPNPRLNAFLTSFGEQALGGRSEQSKNSSPVSLAAPYTVCHWR